MDALRLNRARQLGSKSLIHPQRTMNTLSSSWRGSILTTTLSSTSTYAAPHHLVKTQAINTTRPRRHAGDIGHPQLVRALGRILTLNQIRRFVSRLIPYCRDAAFTVSHTFYNQRHPFYSEQCMSQLTFAEAEYQNKKRKTRRELFLEKMDALIPWVKLKKKLRKYYPKGENGNPPSPLPIMLRVSSYKISS